jgi:hypothetical protein
MPARVTLQDFVDDELLRAPLVAQQALEDTLTAIAEAQALMRPLERAQAAELAKTLQRARPQLTTAYVQALRRALSSDPGATTPGPVPGAVPALAESELSLVDERTVATDVAIAHLTEAIRNIAEHELRELATFVSALAGDMDVSRDHNPMRPEVHARAMWSAVGTTLPAELQVPFMRLSSTPLARVLRKAYAAACARLEDAGVTPAAYRTMVIPGAGRRPRTGRTLTDQALRAIAAELPPSARIAGREPEAPVHADPKYLELLSRLFDAVLADRKLPERVLGAIARVQPAALRVALRDPTLLERYDHPVWAFVDRVAWQLDVTPDRPDTERSLALQHVEGLLDQMAREPDQDAALFDWAQGRLLAFEQERLQRHVQAAAAHIAELARIERGFAAAQADDDAARAAGAIDVGQLDTVPADLMESLPGAGAHDGGDAWLDALAVGDVARLLMQGGWIVAQLLWRSERGELWLWKHCQSNVRWPIRRGAMRLLHAEGLAGPLLPRRLVRDAAEQVAAQLARGRIS